jgi:hypothetical protein
VKPQRYGRDASLMQIAAAVVGSAAAAQVIVPAGQDAERDRPDDAELAGHAYNNTYETTDAPGTFRYAGERIDVVGINGRKLIALRSPEGIWIGGCLVTSASDLERLCAFLMGREEGVS